MKFYVIGIDDSETPQFTSEIKSIIASGKIFTGGVRHYEIVKQMLPTKHQWINVTPPMTTLFKQYAGHDEVVAFASGDPLFYGFASTVQRMMPEAELQVFPHFNSLQMLAHRALIAYHDMRVVSLTGRPWHRFDEALINGEALIGVLTDNSKHTPDKIAQRMLDYGYTNYEIIVGELLGNKYKEKIHTISLEEAASREFHYPNNILLRRTAKRNRPFGIADAEFMHLDGRTKMITKQAIRLATLSELNLRECDSMWDIGFCTGSVSIEAKLQFPHLTINSFEIREACAEIISHNMRKFGAIGIDWHIGDFLETDISQLSAPDAIFIGGHGGFLGQILQRITSVMTEHACIIFNSVTVESRLMFITFANRLGLEVETVAQLTVDNNNTITILKAYKPDNGDNK